MPINTTLLAETIRKIAQSGKGILAADESSGTIKKRFDSIGIESTEENRQNYRDMLFTAPALEKYVSGVILFDETVDQKGLQGEVFSRLLASKGIVPGIKVDEGLEDHPNFPGEKITRGLKGLLKRFEKYAERSGGTLGFAKWRQTVEIGNGIPTEEMIAYGMHAMAEYAAICQAASIVPITEPEVLMDGDHDIARCAEVTERSLTALYSALRTHRVSIPHTILKPNMVLSGKKSGKVETPEEVARATVDVFLRAVPKEVPVIAFLSGGQTSVQATANLNAIVQEAKRRSAPWVFTFSYGRALQDDALKTWKGLPANVKAAQDAFLKRAKLNSLAQQGKYEAAMEKEVVGAGK